MSSILRKIITPALLVLLSSAHAAAQAPSSSQGSASPMPAPETQRATEPTPTTPQDGPAPSGGTPAAPAIVPPQPPPSAQGSASVTPAPETQRASLPGPTAPPPIPMVAKFAITMYGFIELDTIFDSTQSFNETAGNAVIQHRSAAATTPNFAADHERLMMSVRNSRLGFRIRGPETAGLKTSGTAEMDFMGNQPSDATEAQFFLNPTFRIRHMYVKLETPYFDVLAGQTWQLFGWQPTFHPPSVEIQGLPGQVFSRSPQVRVGRAFKTKHVTLDIAIAAARPPQRNAATPDGQAGIKLAVNHWTALHTGGAAGTVADPAAIGVSGTVRRFSLPAVAPNNSDSHTDVEVGWGVSVDALLPILPGNLEERGNALTFTGSYVFGAGIADLYTGLTGGISTTPSTGTPVGYRPGIDPGLVAFNPAFNLNAIKWQSFILGLQYYLPPTGRVWLAGNYSWLHSSNIADIAGPDRASVFTRSQWADANIFFDLNKAVRIGGEYAYFWQKFGDDSKAHNHRGQLSVYYIF